jgi:hypothetical protein
MPFRACLSRRFVDLLPSGSEDEEYVLICHVNVNRNGVFSLPCVPPGTYDLFVADNGQWWPNLRRCLPKIIGKSSELGGVFVKRDPTFRGF